MFMINVVLFEPEIPQNTGNIMRTCAGTDTFLHLIKPLGFKLDEKSIKRCGVNYIEHCNYKVYDNFDKFLQFLWWADIVISARLHLYLISEYIWLKTKVFPYQKKINKMQDVIKKIN